MHGVHQAAPNRWLVRSEQTKFGQDVLDLVQGLRSTDLLHGVGSYLCTLDCSDTVVERCTVDLKRPKRRCYRR